MIFVRVLEFLIVYSFIKRFVLCEFTSPDEEALDSGTSENADEENSVLDSVYDTMRHNYEIKLRQNLARLNLISDIRNKRNINEPMTQANSMDYFKNHQYEVNRKSPVNFPLGFKNAQGFVPIATGPLNPLSPRSDYEYEEYHKCVEKPTVQTFHISDHDQHDEKHNLPGISTVLFTGLKYLLGGFAILALPFIVLKAIFLPFKFFLFLKAFALIKSFFLLSLFFRFLRFNRRTRPFGNILGVPAKHQQKLQTIKDILNSEDLVEDPDYKSDDEDVISKENNGAPMFLDNPFNSSSEVGEEIVQNLVKLIKLKNKKW